MTDIKRTIPNHIKLLCASIAGVSGTVVCYPLDVLRLNMQVSGQFGKKVANVTTWQFASSIYRDDGIGGLYRGLSASMARQALYTGGRLGLFQVLNDYIAAEQGYTTFLQKCLTGSISGACGALIGLPPDVVLTRMAVDRGLPYSERRNYKNVFDGAYRIYRDEGFFTLYRGTTPAIVRAIVVNLSQVVSYFQAKDFLLRNGLFAEDSPACQFVCSVISSVVATTCVLPVDITKTRIQNMKVVDGVPEYHGMLDVWLKIINHERILALWKGFTPLFIRNAPQFIVTFLVTTIFQYTILFMVLCLSDMSSRMSHLYCINLALRDMRISIYRICIFITSFLDVLQSKISP